ncbi:MAG TPA: hypothetical protein VFM18_18565 [Methanosarcina sp.]|nr:hypothetical protein [Methanosarcina sp.]
MAKIAKQQVVITLSTLIKDSDTDVANMVTEDLLTNLEVVTQELVGAGVIVEVSENQ